MTNRQSYGLSLCISGQITYTMNGENYISDQNKAVLLPKGGTYSLHGDKEGFFPVVNFKCENFNCDEIVVVSLEITKTIYFGHPYPQSKADVNQYIFHRYCDFGGMRFFKFLSFLPRI